MSATNLDAIHLFDGTSCAIQNATLLAHAHKSQESHAAQRVIGEIGRTLVKLRQLAETLQKVIGDKKGKMWK